MLKDDLKASFFVNLTDGTVAYCTLNYAGMRCRSGAALIYFLVSAGNFYVSYFCDGCGAHCFVISFSDEGGKIHFEDDLKKNMFFSVSYCLSRSVKISDDAFEGGVRGE